MSWTFFDLVTMFFSSFVLVFLLGFQSKNVQNSRYALAILTSLGISVSNFLFVKFAASGDMVPFVICAAGGCFGIAASIWVSDNIFRKRPESISKCEGTQCHCRLPQNATKAISDGLSKE